MTIDTSELGIVAGLDGSPSATVAAPVGRSPSSDQMLGRSAAYGVPHRRRLGDPFPRHGWRRSKWATIFDLANVVLLVVLLIVVVAGA
jgi:hypothetical protein